MVPLNSVESDFPVGARLSQFSTGWALAPRWHRQVVHSGARWRFASPPPPIPFSPLVTQSPEVDSLLHTFLAQGVIEPSRHPRVVSRIFTVPKPNGTHRLIIDLSRLNRYVRPRRLWMPGIRHLTPALQRSSWMAKIDLQDAYLHVPIHASFRDYLAFRWGPDFFRFRALPFGLSAAPAIFTALLQFPLRTLRSAGIPCIAYLDDWILWGATEAECLSHVSRALSLLKSLGFLINVPKSHLEPSQTIEWLGVEWDSRLGRRRLPHQAALLISNKASRILDDGSASRLRIESLLGSLAFAGQISPLCKLKKKMLGPILASWPSVSRTSPIPLPALFLQRLRWWTSPERVSEWHNMRVDPEPLLAWADASERGWGAHLANGRWTAGDWNLDERSLHINLLEILAIRYLVASPLVPEGSHLHVHTDNVTALFAVNHQGSTRSLQVTDLVATLQDLCTLKRVTLRAFRIPGSLNVVADSLSRVTPLHTEWELDPRDRTALLSWVPELEVDLMATPFNSVLPSFVCPFPHPQASGVDVHLVDWTRWSAVYIFPPSSLLVSLLPKILRFPGLVLLVARVPLAHPLHPALASRVSQSRPLLHPPRQPCREGWFTDSSPNASPWTAFLLLPASSGPRTVNQRSS